MSTLIIAYLALEDGRIVGFENPTSKKTVRHAVYDSVLLTPDGEIPLEVRTYAGNNPVLPNGTIVFVVGKLAGLNEDASFVDAIKFVPVPGDPTDDTYEDGVPDMPHPLFCVTGQIVGSVSTSGSILSHTLTSSEWIRDVRQPSKFTLLFDTSKPRWRHKPELKSGATVQVVGTAGGVHNGTVAIAPDNIVLSFGAPAAAPDAGGSVSPARSKKFGSAKSVKRVKTSAAAQGEQSLLQAVPLATEASPSEQPLACRDFRSARHDGSLLGPTWLLVLSLGPYFFLWFSK